jgi:hypothetical protein
MPIQEPNEKKLQVDRPESDIRMLMAMKLADVMDEAINLNSNDLIS